CRTMYPVMGIAGMDAQADTRPKLTPTALAVGLAVLAGLLRLIDHPWNFTAMGAIGIFAGARMRGLWSFAVPLLIRAGTDLILSHRYEGFPVFDPFVYGSYVVCVLLGWTLRQSRSPVRILSAGVASSIVFFLVTNLGAWVLWPETYPDRSWSGIFQSYQA